MDVEAVLDAATRAVRWIEAEKRPFFLELLTYRFRAHSMFDPELYRTRAEVEEWKKKDPITTFRTRLEARGSFTPEDLARIESRIGKEIQTAVAFAEAGTWEPLQDLTKDVYTPSSEGTSP